MAELDGTVEETLEDFNGSGYTETEYALRDFPAKEIAINAVMIGLDAGGGPGGTPDAADVDFTPAGTIAATDVQAALEELDADIQAIEPGEGSGGWPVREFIIASTPPKTQTNFDNFSSTTDGQEPFGVVTSDNTNGAFIEWFVSLAEGTYALSAKGWPFAGSGIIVFSLSDDGGSTRDDINTAPYSASSASWDQYVDPGGASAMRVNVTSDITIPTSGVYVLRATVTGKHASSSGHATNINWIMLQMVGA